jgi:chromosome partitioning protein
MGHVICIASQKGGTGKTTTAVNMAASFALFEKKTLVVDCDPLGNATTAFGVNKAKVTRSLFHALTEKASFPDVMIETGLPFLSLIPANADLFFVENREVPPIDHSLILRDFILNTAAEFDYIIIDSPPSLGYLTLCALSASDFIIIPTQRRIFSFEGLNQLLSLIKRVRSDANPNLKIAGILFTMIEDEWRASYEAVPDFLVSLKGSLFKTAIPWDTTLADASDFGKPGVLYDIGAPGPSAYLMLTQEIHHNISFSTRH